VDELRNALAAFLEWRHVPLAMTEAMLLLGRGAACKSRPSKALVGGLETIDVALVRQMIRA
jgi:hypothetical protein